MARVAARGKAGKGMRRTERSVGVRIWAGSFCVSVGILIAAAPGYSAGKGPAIEYEYSKVRDETAVSTKPVSIPSRMDVAASYSYDGKTPIRPDNVALTFSAVRNIQPGKFFSDRLQWQTVDKVYLRYGDTKLSFPAAYSCAQVRHKGIMAFFDAQAYEQSGASGYREALTITLPLKTFLEMSRSHEILFEMGKTDTKLTGGAKLGLEALIQTMLAAS